MNGAHDLGGMHGFGPVEPEPDEPVFHAEWERRAFALTLAMGAWRRWNLDMSRSIREQMPPAEYLATTYYEHWLFGLERLLVDKGFASADEIERVQRRLETPSRDRVEAAGTAASAEPRGEASVAASAEPRGEASVAASAERPVEASSGRSAAASEASAVRTATVQDGALGLDGVSRMVHNRRGARLDDPAPPTFQVGQGVRARNLHPLGHTRLPRYCRGRRGVIAIDHGVFIFPDTHAAGHGTKPQHVYSVQFTARELWGPDASANDRVYVDLWDDYLEVAP
jgi:hypothetical protein